MQRKLNTEDSAKCRKAAALLHMAFCWKDTPEGESYWSEVYALLIRKGYHGTSDGKPWQEPVDEPIATPFEECKCDMRTRLVGDGCEVCNPELAKELSRPDTDVYEQSKQPVPSRPVQVTPINPQ